MTPTAMLNEALTSLLDGAVDYAGTFPPARLAIADAAANYLQYRASPQSRLLGRFVCAASHLSALDAEFAAGVERLEGRLSLIVDDEEVIRRASQSHVARTIDSLEIRGGNPTAVVEAVRNAAGVALGPTTMFVEMPADAAPQSFAAVLRDLGAGLKFRTGGLTADAVPSAEQLAAVVVACRDHGLPWKATAGLHQPFRRLDAGLGCRLHGFVNLFVAAVLADVHRLPTADVAAILDDEAAEHFRFTSNGLSWCDQAASIAAIAEARRRGLRSFGSCSFTEPVAGLTTLGI